MTKEFYRILEITETATAEEIKKAYRKLAVKWHPDKFATKSLDEKQEANKKMQEINKAYEVLGDEEKRKRYDLGAENFAGEGTYRDYDEELNDFLRRKETTLEAEIEETTRRIKLIGEFLLRRDAINEIKYELAVNHLYTKDLDPSLWTPYETYIDMIYEIEVGDDENDIEFIDKRKVNEFKDKMIKAIRERKIQLDEEKMKKASSDLERTRIKEISAIEKELANKNLKVEDLDEKYRNYEEEVNNLAKIFRIRSLADKVVRHIRSKGEKKFEPKKGFDWKNQGQLGGKLPLEPTKQNKITEPADKKEFQIDDYDNWTKEELIAEIKKNKLNNEDLKQLVQQLEKIISSLEKEIQELKQENDNSPEFQAYLNQKEQELEQLKDAIKSGNFEKQNSQGNNSNNFPTGLVIGGGILVVVGLAVVLVVKQQKKKNKIL